MGGNTMRTQNILRSWQAAALVSGIAASVLTAVPSFATTAQEAEPQRPATTAALPRQAVPPADGCGEPHSTGAVAFAPCVWQAPGSLRIRPYPYLRASRIPRTVYYKMYFRYTGGSWSQVGQEKSHTIRSTSWRPGPETGFVRGVDCRRTWSIGISLRYGGSQPTPIYSTGTFRCI
jgi:hypothetical protein